jgi:hypothetical protein
MCGTVDKESPIQAVCGQAARTDLRGGPLAREVPTATVANGDEFPGACGNYRGAEGAVLMSLDESDPEVKRRQSAFAQALADLGWSDGRNMLMDLRWAGGDTIGCERSRRSWSACNPIS